MVKFFELCCYGGIATFGTTTFLLYKAKNFARMGETACVAAIDTLTVELMDPVKRPLALRKEFDEADKDHNGKLDVGEVYVLLYKKMSLLTRSAFLSVGYSKEESVDNSSKIIMWIQNNEELNENVKDLTAKVFAQLDTNHDGNVDYEEFVQGAEQLTVPLVEIKKTVSEYPVSSSGYFTASIMLSIAATSACMYKVGLFDGIVCLAKSATK